MKTYKTWEVWQMWIENPSLKFINKDEKGEITMYLDDNGYVNADGLRLSDGLQGNITPNDEWRILPNEVSFLDAVEAFQNGENIYCKLGREKFSYNHCMNEEKAIGFNLAGKDNPITTREILEGHWYIKEEEKR